MILYREAPAYQEFAASTLADYNFRSLPLLERGAYYTIKLECWVNKRVPSNPQVLSKFLGLPQDKVASVLCALSPFFEIIDGWLYCPELVKYQDYLDARRKAQSEGGKRGAAKTNAKHIPPSGTPRVPRSSLDKHSKAQSSTTQSKSVINKEDLDDEWVTDYDQADRY